MFSAIVFAALFSLCRAQLEQSFFQPNPFGSSTSNHSTYDVDVGRSGLTFEPSIVKAQKGDTINFHFWPSNHSVAESTFDKPCQPKAGGIDVHPIYSGFVPTKDGPASKMFSMILNTTDPIWLYCSQPDHDHCKSGQVMVINPLNYTTETLSGYLNGSKATTNTSSPKSVFGGVLIKDNGAAPNVTATGIDVAMQTKKSGAVVPKVYGSTLAFLLVLLVTFVITL